MHQISTLYSNATKTHCSNILNRTLLASENQSARWENEVADMEAHTENRKRMPGWHVDKINVAGFLRGPCKLANRFTEDLIMHVCGILEVIITFDKQFPKIS